MNDSMGWTVMGVMLFLFGAHIIGSLFLVVAAMLTTCEN